MSKKLAYYQVLNELEEDENFIDKALDLLSKVDDKSTYTADNAVTGILNYWASHDELTCYRDELPIYNHDDNKGGDVYGVSGKSNESLHEFLTFDAQELINKLKIEGFDLPDFLQELEEFFLKCLETIDWNDWLNREYISFYEAMLLSRGQNPADFEDPEQFDQDDEFVLQAWQWIKDKKLKAKAILNIDGSSEYLIEPLSFFNLARLNIWSLPKELHEILDDFQSQQSDTKCGDAQLNKPFTDEQTDIKTNKVSQCFAKFKDLYAREVSVVMLEDATIKMVIKGISIKVHPDELGLKAGSQDWKLLEIAAANQGSLAIVLKMLNSTSNLEKEKGKIKTAVSRLRKSLKDAMGLKDDPIKYKRGSGYNFTFKTMTHELLKDGNVSKGDDAMDHIDDKGFDDNQHGNSDFYDEDDDEYGTD